MRLVLQLVGVAGLCQPLQGPAIPAMILAKAVQQAEIASLIAQKSFESGRGFAGEIEYRSGNKLGRLVGLGGTGCQR